MDALWKDNNIFYNILCFLITENEKIFDRNDARLYWKTVIHIFSITHHSYIGIFALNLDINNSDRVEIQTLSKFRAGYLTGWNFIFQTMFLSLALTHDVLEWLEKHETKLGAKIRYWRDIVFSGFVVPVTLFVTTMFWTLFWIDRELVFPQVFDAVVPWWFNHCVHTNIFVVVALETLLQPRRRPTDFKIETLSYATIVVLYAIVYYSIFFFGGRWLYKVFGIMTWWQVCLYQALIFTATHVFYRIQYPINRLIHGQEAEESKTEVIQNGTAKENRSNGVEEQKITNGVQKNDTKEDLRSPPFTDKSWRLKYRSIRNQFENSSL